MLKFLPKLGFIAFGFLVGLQSPTHQSYAPTEKEIIEILADYDVRHLEAPPGTPFYGATDMDNHIIYIMNNQDFIFKRRTVIHELAHVVARMRNEEWDDDTIKIIEEEEYKRLFITP